MRPPPDKILSFVDDIFFTDENAEAETIILALGILNQLVAQPPFPSGRSTQVATIGFHPTHWLLVARFHGHASNEDNGFAVAGWPKRKFSDVAFSLQAAQIAAAVFGAPSGAKLTMIDSKPQS